MESKIMLNDNLMIRKYTRTNVFLISKELWAWAQYKAKILELKSVSEYLFMLIEQDRERDKEKELLSVDE